MIVTDNVKGIAHKYVDVGLSVIPVTGKIASIDWKIFMVKRASHTIVDRWAEIGVLNGVGIVTGKVSDNLVVLDLDGDDAVQAFGERFEHDAIMDTWTVRSGSGHGLHVYWRVQNLPRTSRALGLTIGNVELRANGCYVVAPPSIHPTTNAPYVVYHRAPIRRLDNLEPVREWMASLIRRKMKALAAAHPAQMNVKNASAWAMAALRSECTAVRMATNGRNNTLNRAAFKMGQLVAAGQIDRGTVETALAHAASHLSADDGERATLATIQSGLDAGIGKPR